MTQQPNEDAVRRTVMAAVSADRAFGVFTDGLATWWPREYTFAGDALETIGIEPRAGGRCFERSADGHIREWGRVLAWDPPRRLVFSWQISPARTLEPDPAKASEVEVRFVAVGPAATRIDLEHRGFARHGAGGAGYRAALDAAEGWTYILERYRAALA